MGGLTAWDRAGGGQAESPPIRAELAHHDPEDFEFARQQDVGVLGVRRLEMKAAIDLLAQVLHRDLTVDHCRGGQAHTSHSFAIEGKAWCRFQ